MASIVASSNHARGTARNELVGRLQALVGKKYVLTGDAATRRYRSGFRFGTGRVLAVVRPGTLVEQWAVLQACVDGNVIVIPQASNTGLTGGSTPDGDKYDRDIVIISTTRMRTVYVIDEGRQVVCLPGATLDQLEKVLRPLGREPHSVIGSSCIGASVMGGVCNNSGGALIRRGPAYTEMAVFAQVDADGRLSFINHLGIDLGVGPDEVLCRLDRGQFDDDDVKHGVGDGSDSGYATYVRDVDAASPARFNADAQRHFEVSGSAGKLMVFAVRLDTFPIEENNQVFYIGTNSHDELTEIRRHILQNFDHLPIAAEYLHRGAFDIAEKYGKDTFLAISLLGTARVPMFFALKSWIDALCDRLGLTHMSDRLLQAASNLFPSHLPRRMTEFRDKYEHHLMLKVASRGVGETRSFLSSFFSRSMGGYFECAGEEGAKAFLHRFAAAGAAVRYRAVHADAVEDIVALDIALRRNDRDWVEVLPLDIERTISEKLYYGHFFCHVFHQDYIVKKGYDCLEVEHAMWKLLDERGAEYPAEHNVGHLYPAKPALAKFYRDLDPCNCFNAGIGQMSKFEHYREAAA